jgi:hypothetical protein
LYEHPELKKVAPLAERFDFTAIKDVGDVPPRIYSHLGENDSVRSHRALRMRTVAAKAVKEAERGDELRGAMQYLVAYELDPQELGSHYNRALEEGWGHAEFTHFLEEVLGDE